VIVRFAPETKQPRAPRSWESRRRTSRALLFAAEYRKFKKSFEQWKREFNFEEGSDGRTTTGK
jgi:hypothetical protein